MVYLQISHLIITLFLLMVTYIYFSPILKLLISVVIMIVKRTLVRILMQIFNHLEGESVSPYNKHINNIIKFLIFVINDPRKRTWVIWELFQPLLIPPHKPCYFWTVLKSNFFNKNIWLIVNKMRKSQVHIFRFIKPVLK
jgi:hypothetical protein